mmetsp:Transcript_50150/g.108960  ORF Transcript_50150/g.108960 Transcript_50150/m.108960 type:complete len:403 (+) Transcript_50150:80-1288(+)
MVSAMKRKASTAVTGVQKKRASEPATHSPEKDNCKILEAALKACKKIPGSVQHMLAGAVAVSLGITTEERHAYQNEFVAMIGDVLEGVAADKQQLVELAQKGVEEVISKREMLEGEVARQEAHVLQLQADLGGRKEAFGEASAVLTSAIAALKEAESKQLEGDQGLAEVAKLSEKLRQLKETVETDLAQDKSTIKEFQLVGEQLKFEPAMLEALPYFLAKAPADRGSFDVLAAQQLVADLSKHIAAHENELAEGDSARASWASAVQAAQASLDGAKAAKEGAKDARGEAAKAWAFGKAALAANKAEVKSCSPELKEAQHGLSVAQDDLAQFTENTLTAFRELKEAKPTGAAPGQAAAEEPSAPELDCHVAMEVAKEPVANAEEPLCPSIPSEAPEELAATLA